MQTPSSLPSSNQPRLHPRLAATVRRHLGTQSRKPVAPHTVAAFKRLLAALADRPRPLVLDSFCGTGHSTANLARQHPGHLVVGIDKSGHRLERHPDGPPGQYLLLQAECEGLWRLLAEEGIGVDHHYLLYPNPWPKAKHLQRRVHGSAGFHWLLQLAAGAGPGRTAPGGVELRSNWQTYVEEFGVAMHLAGFAGTVARIPPEPPALSLFERKYRASGHELWAYTCRCSPGAARPPLRDETGYLGYSAISIPGYFMSAPNHDPLWDRIRDETIRHANEEPMLASFLHATILNHDKLEGALSFHLANQLDSPTASSLLLRDVMLEAFESDPTIHEAVRADLQAVLDRDSACHELYIPFLYFKGFHALQTQRVAHWLWLQGRESLALFFQNRMSTAFGVDIHPAARMGKGIMLDHATGLVIGETAVVGNNVSILQSVTLGGTGKDEGDRHPKIGDGVLISAGAKILGNIRVGEGAKVGAGSVVLEDVPPHTTVAGVPAKVVGRPASDQPALEMEHDFCCDETKAQQKAG